MNGINILYVKWGYLFIFVILSDDYIIFRKKYYDENMIIGILTYIYELIYGKLGIFDHYWNFINDSKKLKIILK